VWPWSWWFTRIRALLYSKYKCQTKANPISLFFPFFLCWKKKVGKKKRPKKKTNTFQTLNLPLSTFQLKYIAIVTQKRLLDITQKQHVKSGQRHARKWVPPHLAAAGSTPRKSGPPTAGGSRTRNTGDGTPPSDSASCSSPPRTSSTSRGSWKSDRYIHTTGFPAKAGRRKGRSRRNEGQEDDGGEKERREKENDDACVASRKEGQINLAFEERERERERGSERENSRSVYKGVADLI